MTDPTKPVERYGLMFDGEEGWDLYRFDDGEWVKYEHHASLLSEYERVMAERDEAISREADAWRRANTAEAKVKGWEDTVVVAGLPERVVRNDGWGPGSDELVSVPHVTPEKLTSIIDRLSEATARSQALEAENKRLREALEPFANFAQVMDTAADENGQSSICLYAGKPPAGGGIIERSEDEEITLFERLDDEACLFGTVGGWKGIAASFVCPVLQVKHFRAALEASR